MSLGFSRSFRFGLYGLAVFILAASMYALAKPSTAGTVPEVSSADHVRGENASAPVTLIEYSDFQCPACAAFDPLLQDISTSYGDQVRLVYRHFPLYSIHANADEAAFAAEAASLQGKFWEMHDLLFDRQEDWENLAAPSEMFAAYADLLGLDVEKFKADMASDAVRDRVKVDVSSGNSAGISATPTLYLNGAVVTFPANTNPSVYLKELIDSAIAATSASSSETNTSQEE